MKLKSLALATAAATLAAAPIAAQASIADRTAPMREASELAGGDAKPILIIAAIGAVGIALLALTGDDDDDDIPVST